MNLIKQKGSRMTPPDQDTISWLWSLLSVPFIAIGKLVWNNHVRVNRFETALAEHREWVSNHYPDREHLKEKLEDIITPVQLGQLRIEKKLDDFIKDQANKK